MPGFTVNGTPSKTTFLHTEAHKTTQEFVAVAAIKRGQHIKLDATGLAAIWTTADLRDKWIGVAYNDAAIGENVTVWTRGYAIVFGLSNAALTCDVPVTVSSYDSSTSVNGNTGYVKYANSTTLTQDIGWALDAAAGAGELIRILLMD